MNENELQAEAPFLSKGAILEADDLPMEVVHVPEWGGNVYVRAMTGAERDAFETSCIATKGKKGKAETNTLNVRAKLAVRTVCDENRERLFTNADDEALGKKSGKALDRVFPVASRLSGITDDDIEELEGN